MYSYNWFNETIPLFYIIVSFMTSFAISGLPFVHTFTLVGTTAMSTLVVSIYITTKNTLSTDIIFSILIGTVVLYGEYTTETREKITFIRYHILKAKEKELKKANRG